MKSRPTPTRILDDDATKPAKPIVLVLLGAYWPNHDATGPNQSFRAYVTALSDEFEFMVVGRDGPSGSDSAEDSRGRWTDDGLVKTRHCRISRLGAEGLRDILRATPHDLMILNGFFDREFTIPALAMRRLGLIPRLPTILAPRGEFSAGALGLKHVRKQGYLLAARGLGLLDDVRLHATSEQEADEIRDGCPWARDIVVAPNIRALGPPPQAVAPAIDGRLRIVFLSRVDRKKNLDYAIKLLANVRAPVTFDIFGPANDPAYWAECEQLISRLPAHVEAHYRGLIPNADVAATLVGYDLFLLPTRGENFGHAIFDALEVGLPVLISDQTPWRELERIGAGWSLPLADPDRFAATIDRMAALAPTERIALRRAARALAESSLQESDAVARMRVMLNGALRCSNEIAWTPR
jgi:glycosyltransferase involved in cell wall biosynthesis